MSIRKRSKPHRLVPTARHRPFRIRLPHPGPLVEPPLRLPSSMRRGSSVTRWAAGTRAGRALPAGAGFRPAIEWLPPENMPREGKKARLIDSGQAGRALSEPGGEGGRSNGTGFARAQRPDHRSVEGIGKAIALELAREGVAVALTARALPISKRRARRSGRRRRSP